MSAFYGVLFDLGSTLIYFNGDWEDVFSRSDQAAYVVLKAAGIAPGIENFPELFRERLREYHRSRDVDLIEHTTEKILRDLLAEQGFPDVPQPVVDQALARMYAVSQEHWHVEPDALETLQQLQERGYRLGVISNAANREDVCTLVENAGLNPYLDFVLTSAESGMRKPSPSIFRQGLDHWGVSPDEVVMVGDLLRPDILGAQQFGIFGVWVTRWAQSEENRKYAGTISPDAEIATLAELPGLMDRLEMARRQAG